MAEIETSGSEAHQPETNKNEQRREFLKTVGKAVLVTPPAMTILLSTSLDSEAIAASGGKHHHGKSKKHHYGKSKKRSFLAKLLKLVFSFGRA